MPLALEDISKETLDAIKKATSGINASSGVLGYDLTGLVNLVPVNTPFRNMLAREASPDGNKFTTWRAMVNLNSSQPDPSVAFDYAGSLVQTQEQDVYAPYAVLSMAGQVTQDAIDLAKGFADANALETLHSLNQLMIGEDKKLIGGQNFALPTPGTITLASATTGGSIGASTAVHVRVAARTGSNYFYGGSGVASADATLTTGSGTSTNSVTATVPAVKGAVAYDWFVGASSTSTAEFYYTTTVVNTALITAIPTAAQALPTNLPSLSTTAPTTAPTADGSAKSTEFNGILAATLGDYGTSGLVTPGSGTGSGAQWTSLDGGTLTVSGQSITQIDALLLNLWNSVYLSPTALMMNAQQANDISAKILGSSTAVTFLQPEDVTGRANISAGGYVGSYLNKAAGGTRIRMEVHPHVPPGTIIARTDSVPFPGANIDKVWSVRTLRDYSRFDYGAHYNPGVSGGGPREIFETRSVETLVGRAPTAQAILSNIAAG